jgi:predicted nucleic acid-binding protein
MILCDTNILIEFYKNNASIVQELGHIGQDQLANQRHYAGRALLWRSQ